VPRAAFTAVSAGQTLSDHCALTRRQHFSVSNEVLVANLKVWHQIENPTPSIDAYVLKEHSWQISSPSDLKQRSLTFFEDGHPQKNNKTKQNNKTTTTTWVAIWDQFLTQKKALLIRCAECNKTICNKTPTCDYKNE